MTHYDYIYKLLKANGSLVGSELKSKLAKRFNISDANARQIIHRLASKGLLYSTKPVSFGKGQFGYYVDTLSVDNIMKISKNRPPMHRILVELKKNDGVLSYYECYKVSALPLDNIKTKKNTLEEVINELTELGVLAKSEVYNDVKFIMTYDATQNPDSLMNHYNRMKIDVLFMRDIMKWIRSTNLVDNFVRYRSNHEIGKGAFENNYIWDAFGFCKSTGFNTIKTSNKKSDDKKALAVLDVKISTTYDTNDLDGFFERVQGVLCSSKENKYKVIPIVFTSDITDEARAKLINLGFIHYSLGAVFGDKIFKVIQKYIDIIELTSDFEMRNEKFVDDFYASRIEETMESILSDIESSGQSINLSNMKGDLFELAIFILLKELLAGYEIEHSVKLTNSFEYDFVAKKKLEKRMYHN